jgi:glucose-6-phosphate-specific signal transduction histidine kinase
MAFQLRQLREHRQERMACRDLLRKLAPRVIDDVAPSLTATVIFRKMGDVRTPDQDMDRVFSTRLDEATLDELNRVTRRLGVTKRRFLQEAIRLRAQQADAAGHADVWAETLGAWQRREGAPATIRRIRKQFRQSFQRHQARQDEGLRR